MKIMRTIVQITKRDVLILIGNIVDHFDTALYIFMAPLIASVFFPFEDETMSLIAACSVFCVSIITRPLGAYIFGVVVKQKGAAYGLSISLTGLGVCSVAIGVLPGYSIIGYLAPILLVILRSILGIFAAGEANVAKLYILHNKLEKNAFMGSYVYELSTILGIISASIAAAVINYYSFEDGWRYCFVTGGTAAIIGYILRSSTIPVDDRKANTVLNIYTLEGFDVIWQHKRDIVKIIIVTSVSQITYVLPFITMNHILPLISKIDASSMMISNSIILCADMVMILIIGRFLVKCDYFKAMKNTTLILAISIIPLWCFLENANIIYMNFVRGWIVITGIIYLCPLNLWCKNQIRGDDKYIVIGMANTISSCLFGKLTPVIFLSLYYYTNSHTIISIYAAVIFFASFLIIGNSRNKT